MSVALWLRQDKFTQTTKSCGGKGTAWPLSQEENTPNLALTDFYWLNLHRNTGHIHKAHQSLPGRNDQIIDNKELWVLILSQGQIAKGAENFGETNSFHAWTLII